jgi:hypothetical protein
VTLHHGDAYVLAKAVHRMSCGETGGHPSQRIQSSAWCERGIRADRGLPGCRPVDLTGVLLPFAPGLPLPQEGTDEGLALRQPEGEREGGETQTIAPLRRKFFDNSGDRVSVRLWEPLAEPNRFQPNELRSTVADDKSLAQAETIRRSRKAT